MPRPRNPIPPYKCHKASGVAYCRTADGKNHYFGKHGTADSKRQYAEFVARLDVEAPAIPAATEIPDDVTVVELADRYMLFASGYYIRDGQPTSQLDAVKRAVRRVTDAFGLQRPCDLN